ncbi:MAG: LSU ribosomal protein L31 RpmE [Bacteroidetes bacterium HLUCCA01]|nr:MAG: LSU ribosomal protein L31 RpmE [Bacteroidetes bacterium HLUCCA01]
MKQGIHPDYKEITVQMSDGSEFVTRSTINTREGIYKTEVDSKNHPFYIGSDKMINAAGRVDKFNKKYGRK